MRELLHSQRLIATLGADRRVDHLELFAGCQIVTLIGNHVDDRAAGGLLCLVHQKLQLLLAANPIRPLISELLTGIVLIFSRIGEHGGRTHCRRRAWTKIPRPRGPPPTARRVLRALALAPAVPSPE